MSGKLPNGQGSIRKRADGLWEGRITLLDGRRVSFYDQKRDVVVRQLRAAAADRDKGLPVGPEKMTVEQFLTKWLEVKEATLRSPRTWERYAELTRLHIIPALGSINLIDADVDLPQADDEK